MLHFSYTPMLMPIIKPSDAERMPAVDGLRGLAIVTVLFWHDVIPVREVLPQAAWGLAWSSLDLFFVVSGFLLGGNLLDKRGSSTYFSTFYARRCTRILPLYAFTVLCYAAADFALPRDNFHIAAMFSSELPFWSYAVFAQNVFMGIEGSWGAPALSVTWSLALEEQFYLLLPLVLYVMPRNKVWLVCIGCFVVAPFAREVIRDQVGLLAAHIYLPGRVDALMVGVLVALLVRDDAVSVWWRTHRALRRAAVAASGGAAVWLALQNEEIVSVVTSRIGYGILAVFYGSLVMAAVSSREGLLTRLLFWSPLRACGVLCFPLFLWHVPCLHVARALVGTTEAAFGGYLVSIVALPLIFGVSIVTHLVVERPIYRWGRRTFRYERQAPGIVDIR